MPMKEDRRGYGGAGCGSYSLAKGPKDCSKCNQRKDVSEFYRRARNKDRLQTWCKLCTSKANAKCYAESKEHRAAINARWKKDNRERVNAQSRARAAANKEKQSARCKAWRIRNKEYDAFRVKYRKAMIMQAIPKWADRQDILDVYKEAQSFGLHVDHIVPLTSKLVCGLHVWDNLQLLALSHNRAKGNRWWPDQL